MNAEYQRLEVESSVVESQMRELATTVDLSSASGHATFEQQIAKLGRKLASLRQGMSLIRTVESLGMHEQEREFVKALPKKFHSQGTRTKVIHLPGDVAVTLQITYYHRLKTPNSDQPSSPIPAFDFQQHSTRLLAVGILRSSVNRSVKRRMCSNPLFSDSRGFCDTKSSFIKKPTFSESARSQLASCPDSRRDKGRSLHRLVGVLAI